MDLSEIRSDQAVRHPWEVARARAILRILAGRGRFARVLDYGCGDGFTGREVQKALGVGELVGVDSELPGSACGRTVVEEGSYELACDEGGLGERRFDLLLLCDVIEHVPQDVEFVRGIVDRRLAPGSLVLLTVPAFQQLFSEHDRALRHYRRYSFASLSETARNAGLDLIEGGYLFASLLAPRLLSKTLEAVHGPSPEHGIGGWKGGPIITRWLTRTLELENSLILGANRRGVRVPGLSTWALCKTQS